MGLTLKAARVNKNLTTAEAAQKLGITPSTLSAYERGRSYPDVPKIKRMEEIYCVSYNDLIFLPSDNG